MMKKNNILAFLLFGLIVLNGYAARPDSDVKEQIKGLIDRQNTSWANQDGGKPQFTMDNVNQFPGLYAGTVINTTWAELQPTQAGELDVSTIEGPLEQIKAYNKKHPDRPLAVKLRVLAGANAPQWAKSLDGEPVTLYRNKIGSCTGAPSCPLTVGKFWNVHGQYVKAWRALQRKLAKVYDQEPLIRQIGVSSCSQQTDEPFVPTIDKTAKDNLHAAGYSDEAQAACLMTAAPVDYRPWTHTLVDFPINPFSHLDRRGQEMGVTEQVIDACISKLGKRCVLDTEGTGKAGHNIDNTPVFASLKAHAERGAYINLQTASPRGMGIDPNQAPDMTIWRHTFEMAHELGAKGVEVWSEANFGGLDKLSMQQACSLVNILLPGETPKPPC